MKDQKIFNNFASVIDRQSRMIGLREDKTRKHCGLLIFFVQIKF